MAPWMRVTGAVGQAVSGERNALVRHARDQLNSAGPRGRPPDAFGFERVMNELRHDRHEIWDLGLGEHGVKAGAGLCSVFLRLVERGRIRKLVNPEQEPGGPRRGLAEEGPPGGRGGRERTVRHSRWCELGERALPLPAQ